MKKIWMAATECVPFIKCGGLADVIGSLPQELVKLDYEVSIFLPLYQCIAKTYHKMFSFVCEYSVRMKYEDAIVRIFQLKKQGVTYYFVEHQGYFERDNIYGYYDDGERFAYFQKVILQFMHVQDQWPDLLHCHDWHTGMLPVLCKTWGETDARYQNIRHIYTIHNLAYQGNFDATMLESCLGLPYTLFEQGDLRFDDGISFMKAGILYADKITTVSKSYREEILTQCYGERMHSVLQLRKDDLIGILNGIDVEVWDTKKDTMIYENYNKVNVLKGKRTNKVALQKEMGLQEDPEVCLFGMVTRLTWQKGISYLLEQAEALCRLPIQLIILGSGDIEMESALINLQERSNGKVVFYRGYQETLAHRIYAGSDLFLMPSKFEPCGISQLISMHYGTIPLVRETGGLKDTVEPYNAFAQTGNGFTFAKEDSKDFLHVLEYALEVYYHDEKAWRKLVRRAMATDVSWNKRAMDYAQLYESL